MAVIIYQVQWTSDGDERSVDVTVGEFDANETEEAARIRCARKFKSVAETDEFEPDQGTTIRMTRHVDGFAQSPPCQTTAQGVWATDYALFLVAVTEHSW